MNINDYDIRVLVALNKIQNGEEVETKDLTSWVVMKKLSPKSRDAENSHVLSSLKKMNKLGLIKYDMEKNGHKIKRIWGVDYSNVFFGRFRFPDGRRDIIRYKIEKDWLIRSLRFTEKKL